MNPGHLVLVALVAEAAMEADRGKAESYLSQLVRRLDTDGEGDAADRLRKVLDGRKAKKASLARREAVPASGGSRPPVDAETAFGIADREDIPVGGVELVLPVATEAMVKQIVRYVSESERLKASGVAIAPTLLMYGPPGTGKTQAARFIASELGLPLVTARADGLISSYLGSTSKNVRRLFEYARSEPCVLFLDEFDSIAKMRDDGRELGELKRIVISLLQNIDTLDGDHVLLAATNHEHLLDPAIWRRFAYKAKFDLPGEAERERLLRNFFGRYLVGDVTSLLVPLTAGLSGAQIKLAAEECIRAAVLEGAASVEVADAIAGLLQERGIPANDKADLIRFLHDLDSKTYNQPGLARLFNVSQPYISKSVRKGKRNG